MNLLTASNQWANRPADERFETLDALYAATKYHADNSRTKEFDLSKYRAEKIGDEIALVGDAKVPATFSHWSFGQLARTVGAPAAYLRDLPATLAVQNLNHGLAKLDTTPVNALFHANGELRLRALTSDRYTRIWDYEIVERLQGLPAGWRTPPARPAFAGQPGTRPATEADVLNDRSFGLSINVGDPIAPAGLYASDHDLFAFLVNEDRRIAEPGNPEGLCRGFFVSNSEVGAASFAVTTFLYRHVCGNHIVWGAEKVNETRIRHIGNAGVKAFGQFAIELKRYADSSVSDLEARVASAKTRQIAATKDEVLDFVFGRRIPDLSRRTLGEAYDLAEQHVDTDGSPRTVWGLAQGLTRLSQQTTFADDRVKLDRAAGRVLDIAF